MGRQWAADIGHTSIASPEEHLRFLLIIGQSGPLVSCSKDSPRLLRGKSCLKGMANSVSKFCNYFSSDPHPTGVDDFPDWAYFQKWQLFGVR